MMTQKNISKTTTRMGDLLAIPPDWEYKSMGDVARVASELMGIDWVDENTILVVSRPGPSDNDGIARCPMQLMNEKFAEKVDKVLGRPLKDNERAMINERYARDLAGTPLQVGVTGSMMCMDIRAQDGSALEIIAFVQVRTNGNGDGLEWYVDFSARAVARVKG